MNISPEESRKLGISNATLRDRYITRLEKSDPEFWVRNRLGHEPRTYTITETGTTTYPTRFVATSSVSTSLGATDAASSAIHQSDLVFGFSVNMPRLKKTASFGIDDVEELKFSFEADWDFGMRLPVAATLTSVEPMAEGSSYSLSSTMRGVNFSAAQYAGIGLPTESGHEVYFRWIEQGCLEFSGIIDSGEQCAGPDVNKHEDFVTPFGPGASVPFPTFETSVLDYGIAGIDLDIGSRVGSNEITAGWNVLGAALGSGDVTYSDPASAESLSPVKAIDGPGRAFFSVDGLLYHFTHFTVSPSLKLWVDVHIPIPLSPDIDWDDDWSLNLGTYDLSDFIDHDFIDSNGASVGLHHNVEYTGATNLKMEVEVINVAPTARITVAGGHILDINGAATMTGNVGDVFTFIGRSHDPGRDGLTLSWSWGDGPPQPDQSGLYPLTAATGPNDATDSRTHVFPGACLYDVTLTSVDDDGAIGEDHTSILITEVGRSGRLEGFWQHQLNRNGGGLLEEPLVKCYLAIVERVSTVFSESRQAGTLAHAYSVLNLAANGGSERDQLDRELLVAWLNFASGAIGYSQLLDTNADGLADTPFYEVMKAAETVRSNPLSSSRSLKDQTQIVHLASVRSTEMK